MSVLKIGELAARTGLTVRTLRHYDEVGLLRPRRRTAAGYRLYGADEVRRLQQIVSLRQLGLSLERIGACLDDDGMSLIEVIDEHARRLREQLGLQRRLCRRLEALAQRLRNSDDVGVDELTRTMEEIVKVESYYTPEQLEQLERRRQEVGEERIRQVQQEWAELFDRFRDEMEKGSDPSSEPVRRLARRARGLIEEFTGGDAGIRASLARMYRQEGGPNVMRQHGMQVDADLWEYMGEASAALQQAD